MFKSILISSFVVPSVSDLFNKIRFTFLFRIEVYFSINLNLHITLKQ